MKRCKWAFPVLVAVAAVSVLLSGCEKKEEDPGTREEMLTAISLADIAPGNFYVKSGEAFYLLPIEGKNYDSAIEVKTIDGKENGIVAQETNRLLNFVQKDMAIPTVYKNDQLIYVSTDSINEFTWERYKDYGYSIGISGLNLTDSGKAKSGDNTIVASGTSVQSALAGVEIPEGADLTVDKINGTTISEQYINDGGIITGMSRDAAAQIDFYIGTIPLQVTASADSRYFKSFELYRTNHYNLSTDGYAIVEIPSYFKSGYYLINGKGLVKFLNTDRGVDESGIALDIPYYYRDENGNTMTYYEWQEANGVVSDVLIQNNQQKNEILVSDYPEKQKITIDKTQKTLDISIEYKYVNDEYRSEADKNGNFPRVYLVDPVGNATKLSEDERQTYGDGKLNGYNYLTGSVQEAAAGDWYLLYENFENIYKETKISISSGNATSYLHNKERGSISIYYDASNQAHDFTITWEQNDRTLKKIHMKAPDGTVYSEEMTPGNIMADEAGRYMIKVPSLLKGNYTFTIEGDRLGRVWIDCEASVGFNNMDPNELTDGSGETMESIEGSFVE